MNNIYLSAKKYFTNSHDIQCNQKFDNNLHYFSEMIVYIDRLVNIQQPAP